MIPVLNNGTTEQLAPEPLARPKCRSPQLFQVDSHHLEEKVEPFTRAGQSRDPALELASFKRQLKTFLFAHY